MTQRMGLFTFMGEKKLGDFYWAYADILRGIGINESMYDQRIMAFMALKLLVDNSFLRFNFEYKSNFGLSQNEFDKYQSKSTKESFLNIINDIENLGTQKLKYFNQDKKFNPDSESENILYYLNHKRTFHLKHYIEELPNNYLEMVLDIYIEKAHFVNYPKEDYKDLYEKTISRMKKLSGDLTGQHFTQKSIIHLMCEYAMDDLKACDKEVLAIYDPTCGTGSMLMESAYYFGENIKNKTINVYGQEMHGQTWLLCKIFLEISGIENTIAHGNTLVNPAFDKINGDDSFDFIIANPPFGVDWKHDYDKVLQDMKKGEKSHFFVVKDKNGFITPKKSDGQFLFMMHIIKLLQKSQDLNKHAKAAIISSSTLISTGSDTGSEAKIRKALFETHYLDAVLEQPNAMFTNTDISSHIWFYDTKNSDNIKLVKADTKEEQLFSLHPSPKDKMKNSYSLADIKKLKKYLFSKKDFKYISKTVDTDRCSINISNEIGFKDTTEDISFEELFSELNSMMNEMCKLHQTNKLV